MNSSNMGHGTVYTKGEKVQGIPPQKLLEFDYPKREKAGSNFVVFLFIVFCATGVYSFYQYCQIKSALAIASDYNEKKITYRQAEFLLEKQLRLVSLLR